MPRRPPNVEYPLDPRLHPYRDRVGVLYRGNVQAGLLIVQSMLWAVSSHGHLWWRRWNDPVEAVVLDIRVDGTWFDSVEDSSAFDEVVAEWTAGTWEFNDEALRIEWLSDRDSRLAEDRERLIDPRPAGRLDQVRHLWTQHVNAPFPPRLRGEEIHGVDLVMLDADFAGCVDTWVRRRGKLDEGRRDILRRGVEEADIVIPHLTPEERLYYRRLQRLAGVILWEAS